MRFSVSWLLYTMIVLLLHQFYLSSVLRFYLALRVSGMHATRILAVYFGFTLSALRRATSRCCRAMERHDGRLSYVGGSDLDYNGSFAQQLVTTNTASSWQTSAAAVVAHEATKAAKKSMAAASCPGGSLRPAMSGAGHASCPAQTQLSCSKPTVSVW